MGFKPNHREEKQLLLMRERNWGILGMRHRRITTQALNDALPHVRRRLKAPKAIAKCAPQ